MRRTAEAGGVEDADFGVGGLELGGCRRVWGSLGMPLVLLGGMVGYVRGMGGWLDVRLAIAGFVVRVGKHDARGTPAG